MLTPCLAFRLHLSMLVRPHVASQGLLFSAAPMSGRSPSLVLFLNHGHFVAQTEGPGPQLQVQSRQHSRAGQWHRVRGYGERVGGRAQAMALKLPSSQGPGIPLTVILPTPGVCPLGNAAGPACGGRQPDLEPEGSPPSGPQGRATTALHPLCRRSPCQQLQLQAPCENHTAPIPGLSPGVHPRQSKPDVIHLLLAGVCGVQRLSEEITAG